MPHKAGFYSVGCTNCRRQFELPSLGDMTYGDVLLHGERGTVHRYVCVLDHPVWRVIETVLGPRAPEGSVQWWRALAALADPVEGQHLQVDAVCPYCQADSTHFRTPKAAPRTPRVAEVEDATFNVFLALPADVQRQRAAAAAGKE